MYKLIKIFASITVSFMLLLGTMTTINAQAQDFEFSGNKKSSYQCFDVDNNPTEPTDRRDANGYWLCPCEDGNAPNPTTFRCGSGSPSRCNGTPGTDGCFVVRSVLRPPKLQQLEIWFVRIVYLIWALVGTLSFFFLFVLGYRYMISRGDVTKITEIRQKIIYYILGFGLVFLAVPILTTFFNLLGINSNVACYNVQMPAFQFFFANLCTVSSDNTSLQNACRSQTLDGVPCSGSDYPRSVSCQSGSSVRVYLCNSSLVYERQ